jgi:hypothetical protein
MNFIKSHAADTRRIQPTWRRQKGARKPADVVLVARPSRFGNPFKVEAGRTQAEAAEAFRDWLADDATTNEPKRREWILDNLHLFNGKRAACYCQPGTPCHADVLLELADKRKGGRP